MSIGKISSGLMLEKSNKTQLKHKKDMQWQRITSCRDTWEEVSKCDNEVFFLHFRKTSGVRRANEVNDKGRFAVWAACQ